MPIYAYRCTECGEVTEVLQKISDAALTDCPHCHQSTLNKQVTAPAFRLKGQGWYETDFKGSHKKNLAHSDNHCPDKDSKKSCCHCDATSD